MVTGLRWQKRLPHVDQLKDQNSLVLVVHL